MSIGEIIIIFEVLIIGYIIGSIPTGYIVVKLFKGIDIRTVGSGSTGATNVKRVMGTKWFFIVLLLDALKGAIAVWIALRCFDMMQFEGLSPVMSALAVIIGHSKSMFLRFTGGKSVATAVGTLIALCPIVGAISAVIWGVITYTSKYVSLGSICAVAITPILMNVFDQNEYYIWYATIGAIFVIIRHKDNLKRLMSGKENKVRK